jgi:TetR/AcrR family transcriptional regulator, transcriptional repressor for nem operon
MDAADSIAPAKTRLLDAALKVIRTKGYVATTLDDLCAEAGVTKGSFFHHFKSKEDLALAAVEHWNSMTGGLFAQAPYTQIADPRDRVLAYIDFRAAILQGELPDFTCLLGTMVQETFETHPRIRDACEHGITLHARVVAADIAARRLSALHTGRDSRCVHSGEGARQRGDRRELRGALAALCCVAARGSA